MINVVVDDMLEVYMGCPKNGNDLIDPFQAFEMTPCRIGMNVVLQWLAVVFFQVVRVRVEYISASDETVACLKFGLDRSRYPSVSVPISVKGDASFDRLASG